MRAFSIILILLTGCASLPTGQKLGQAAHRAFFNPKTLVPLAGAAIFYSVENFDRRVSDWAIKHRPVYGSAENVLDTRKMAESILRAETYITALAIPEESEDWIYSKIKRVGIEWSALRAVYSTTSIIKKTTRRIRPGGNSNSSFPSGTTSVAFSLATLSNRNLDYIESDSLRNGLQFGNLFLASSIGWARIESGAHYPSDVLAGAALGHFLSAFIYDAFLGLPENDDVVFAVVPFEGGAMAQVSFGF